MKEKDLEYDIRPFVKKDDKIVVFSFPFFETETYSWLAKYGFFVYQEGYTERRYFLLEMFPHDTGVDKVLWYHLIGYKMLDGTEECLCLQRRIYDESLWFGKPKEI